MPVGSSYTMAIELAAEDVFDARRGLKVEGGIGCSLSGCNTAVGWEPINCTLTCSPTQPGTSTLTISGSDGVGGKRVTMVKQIVLAPNEAAIHDVDLLETAVQNTPVQLAGAIRVSYAPPGTVAITPIGCYNDDPSSRRLPNNLIPTAGAGSNVSLAECYYLAKSAGYAYFSVQSGSTCWAGNDLALAVSFGRASDIDCATADVEDRNLIYGIQSKQAPARMDMSGNLHFLQCPPMSVEN